MGFHEDRLTAQRRYREKNRTRLNRAAKRKYRESTAEEKKQRSAAASARQKKLYDIDLKFRELKRQQSLDYYYRNRDKILKKKKKRVPTEKRKQYNKDYYEKNKEQLQSKRRAKYAASQKA